MTERASLCWERLELASESVLQARLNRTLMLCGLGPPAPLTTPEERMEALLAALPDVRAVRWCQQVHGTVTAAVASEPGSPLAGPSCVGRCDGLLSDEPGIALAVWSADCVPVLLAGGGVVVAVHAGWRGAAAGLPGAAVRRLNYEYGVPADVVSAVLGPAIGPCHYPVGADAIDALAVTGGPRQRWLRGNRVDLRAHIAAQLEAAGVAAAAIARVGGCTACDPALASFRRDGAAAGRQFTLVALTPS